MSALETVKSEILLLKEILESKNYTVNVANKNPTLSEIAETLKTIKANGES